MEKSITEPSEKKYLLKKIATDIAFDSSLRTITTNIDESMDDLFNELGDRYENEEERALLVYQYIKEYSALSWLWEKKSQIRKSKK